MLNRVVFQKDHYSTELFLECKKCQIIPDPESSEWVFVKVNDDILKKFSEIKRDILIIINRNPELYCDCKKFIKLNKSFEEVIKVKTNEKNFTEITCDVKLCVYGIWFGPSSFGPMVRIESFMTNENNQDITFMDQDNSSDEEMLTEYFTKVNLKNKNINV